MTQVPLPTRLSLLATPVSPLGDRADAHSIAWAQKRHLVLAPDAINRLVKTRPGSLAAHCYPTATLPDLCLLADWMTWLFCLDDQGDEGAPGRRPDQMEPMLLGIYSEAACSGVTASSPLAVALGDISQRLGIRMPREWTYRFHHHLLAYLLANVQEAAHRQLGRYPDPEAFCPLRREAGAIMPSFDLIEFVVGTMLPPGLYYSTVFQRLLVSAANVVCWTNDLMTWKKEARHDDMHNLVLVLRASDGLALHQAIDTVVARADEEIDCFLQAEAKLAAVCDRLQLPIPAREAAASAAYLLRSWMHGHVQWGLDTARYLDVGAPGTAEPLLGHALADVEE